MEIALLFIAFPEQERIQQADSEPFSSRHGTPNVRQYRSKRPLAAPA
ncbi:hypothetical protein LUW76_34620 [Actinomadura madurae]|nr:hypothetical protein [Actinomadura madurae]URM99055.1 hypothetical protein LUW76_34620 [Actinomadura madurae]URN09742.1 hypothetical protein LUW74_44615 [Actinomadura madurae]